MMLILIAVMVFYLVVIINGSQKWGNVVSPTTAFVIGAIIWITSKNRENFRLNWMLLVFMLLFWGFTDSLWMIASNIYGLNPEEMPVFMYLYLVPNILLTLAVAIYFIKNIKKWHRIQLILNITVTCIVSIVFLWQIVFKDYNIFSFNFDDFINTFLYLFTDMISVSIIFVMYLSSRVGKPSKQMLMLTAGICLYTLSDLYYTFLVFEDTYVPNTFIDFAYMSAMALFGMSSIFEAYEPHIIINSGYWEASEKLWKTGQYVSLLIIPVFFYMTGNFPPKVLGYLLILVLIYQIIAAYIQGALKNEYLLKKEKQMNEKLEDLITIRTKDLVAANRALDELVKADSVTGLYNRRYFLEELDKTINTKGSKFSVFYMDLDRFKIINDTHGHEMGDEILRAISERLLAWKPENAVIARLGGDEFAILLREHIEIKKLQDFCEELCSLFNNPVIIGEYMFSIEVSIGISRYPVDACDRDRLMKYADIAMYNAKRNYGKKHCILYNSGQGDIVERRSEIEMLLRNVEFDKEFEINFQPQFRLNGNELIGVEALLRWKNPIKGNILPCDFIPIAEETGLILEIGAWVMNKAINQICCWNEKYQLNLMMGINISPKQIDSIHFISGIKKIIEVRSVNPKWIDFEITESCAMNSNIIMEEILTKLSGLGIQISIDDFGTGYSSLSYIKRFDIDRLKIAKELIDNISSDQNALLIVKAIIMMAKGMNLATIAEGVEIEEQLNILRNLGCDEVQGFLISKPVPAEVFENKFLIPMKAIAQNMS
jgi:diguanylate cyclase (GGDEF)-like protein